MGTWSIWEAGKSVKIFWGKYKGNGFLGRFRRRSEDKSKNDHE